MSIRWNAPTPVQWLVVESGIDPPAITSTLGGAPVALVGIVKLDVGEPLVMGSVLVVMLPVRTPLIPETVVPWPAVPPVKAVTVDR